jgi:citrate lyase gamma subunit
MQKSEIIKKLLSIKQEVIKLGIIAVSDIQVPVDSQIIELQLFSNLEDAFTEAIESVNNNHKFK